jgi:flagellar biosynthesis component FlhA
MYNYKIRKMGILESLATMILNKAEITFKVKLAPSVWHIRLKGENVVKTDYIPGHFLRVFAGKGQDMDIPGALTRRFRRGETMRLCYY